MNFIYLNVCYVNMIMVKWMMLATLMRKKATHFKIVIMVVIVKQAISLNRSRIKGVHWKHTVTVIISIIVGALKTNWKGEHLSAKRKNCLFVKQLQLMIVQCYCSNYSMVVCKHILMVHVSLRITAPCWCNVFTPLRLTLVLPHSALCNRLLNELVWQSTFTTVIVTRTYAKRYGFICCLKYLCYTYAAERWHARVNWWN